VASFDSDYVVNALPSGFATAGTNNRTYTMTRIVSATLTTTAALTMSTAEDSSALIASFSEIDAPPPAPIRVTQAVQSTIAKLPPSPIRTTQVVQGLLAAGVRGLRVTQVVRTLITNVVIPPTPTPPGCPGTTPVVPVTGSDGCAQADFVE
jgi:hypothetical protein